eukprot:763218-Hanusia_phi.AAC.1
MPRPGNKYYYDLPEIVLLSPNYPKEYPGAHRVPGVPARLSLAAAVPGPQHPTVLHGPAAIRGSESTRNEKTDTPNGRANFRSLRIIHVT